MTLIGLTGGIAAGKSTVARRLAARGAAVVDSDVLAREAVAPGSPALHEIIGEFGPSVLLPDGSLDRAALGGIIFADPSARARLNAIVHPAVRELAALRIREAFERDPRAVVVWDIPLLAEARDPGEFDLVVVADAPRALRRRRLIEGRGLSPEEADARLDAQATDEQRRSIADVIIDTAGEMSDTVAAVDRLYERVVTASEGNVRGRV